jgi:hypothetical protein
MPSERFGRRQRARLEELAKLKPPTRQLSWDEVARIDRERLWWTMRGLDRGDLMQLLARALAEVPATRLESVFRDRAHPGDIGARQDEPVDEVHVEVKKFCDLARKGHFYEPVPYRGSEQSRGTQEFVARCNVLFNRCVEEHGRADPRDLRTAFELLLDLMRQIDDGEEVVYFTDEAGSWQVGVVWTTVLPAYFSCHARTATKAQFQTMVERALAGHGAQAQPELLRAAEDAWRMRESG